MATNPLQLCDISKVKLLLFILVSMRLIRTTIWELLCCHLPCLVVINQTVHCAIQKFISNLLDSVRPIALPTANDGSFPRMNQEGRLVGFGITDETKVANPSPNPFLKTVYLTVRNNDECLAAFPNVDNVRNFCADDVHPDSTNVCHGDVGSAFVVTNRGQKILVRQLKVRKVKLV